eukprot:COSAG06_NODE_6193_length_3056_cov_4.671627_1_plen_94_part_10
MVCAHPTWHEREQCELLNAARIAVLDLPWDPRVDADVCSRLQTRARAEPAEHIRKRWDVAPEPGTATHSTTKTTTHHHHPPLPNPTTTRPPRRC